MNWLSALLPFLAVVALLYLPGLALAAAVGARRFLLVAVAPAATVGFVAVVAIVFPLMGIRWSLLPVILATVLSALVLWAVRWLLVRRLVRGVRSEPVVGTRMRSAGWTVLAMVLGGILIATQLVVAIGQPQHISQTFDAMFHLNVVRFIEDTGNASSWHISGLVLPPGTSSFYPAAWHDFVSLASIATGAGIPVIVNLSSIAIAALVWPAACVLLMRTLIPGSRAAIVIAGTVSAAFPAFPMLMLNYGVLYPYFLALAMLPLALALGFSIVGFSRPMWPRLIERAVLLAAVLAAIGLAQPSVVFAWFAFTIPLIITRVIAFTRAPASKMRRIVSWALVVVGLGVFAVAWVVIGRLGDNTPWITYTNIFGAAFESVTYSVKGTPVAIALTVFTLVGFVHLARAPGRRWVLGTWAIGAFMFAVAVAMPSWRVRALVVGLFYRDPPRLAALLIMVGLPVAVFGAVAIWSFVVKRVWPFLTSRVSAPARPAAVWIGVVAALLLLVVSTQGIAMRAAVVSANNTYAQRPYSPLLSTDERTLIDRLDTEVPADAMIVGNPWTGTAFTYALANRRVLNPHFSSLIDTRAPLINLKLNQALTDPTVCPAVRALHVEYLLDFGTYSRDAGKTNVQLDSTSGFVGLLDVAKDGVAKEIDRQGDSVLYKITACAD
ncbi:DUF6541 family protein [Leifsonia sp. Root112D2]|uniref:DUF6541 family protein n=1 Tax=Leifsonia sp. Root112D2 TaxID=1736426 RepID=UPI0006F9B178|nr:DUF6541 family protein [Leifsonia sp. Root112D2]KQV06036.1 hypothetical protein ASC63_00595 [Leifsonia sp. Root112D2]